MSKKLTVVIVLIAALVLVYAMGPKPEKMVVTEDYPEVPQTSDSLENFIASAESKHRVKPDNEARIIWFDSGKHKTPFSVVYLHGFSASQEEGDPVHTDFAKQFGCNLYLPRLADHGIDTVEQLLYFSGARLWESSKEALAVGEAIGERVILISTSTGGTMALLLAATFPEKIYAMINMSPNIAINNSSAFLLNNPWGLQIARIVMGGNYQIIDYPADRLPYWNEKYRIEALNQLEELVEVTMTPQTFAKITQPSLTLYYYKDEDNQDPVVKVSAMLDMHQSLSTAEHLKVAIPVPEAGAHVIGSHLVSKDITTVEKEIAKFATETLGLTPVSSVVNN